MAAVLMLNFWTRGEPYEQDSMALHARYGGGEC